MFSFSSGYQVEIVSELRMGARVYFLSVPGPHLVQTCGALCKLQSVCVHMYIYPVGVEGLVSKVSFICSGSYTLSTPSFEGFPEPREKGFDGDIHFRTKSSKASHSLHIVWLCLCICSHLLMVADQSTDLPVQLINSLFFFYYIHLLKQ